MAGLPQGASSLPDHDPALESGLEVGSAVGPVSKLPAERVEAIEVVISDEMAGLGIPGLSVAIAHEYTSLEEGLSLFKDDPLEFEPGTQFLYTTYGYSLLGCAIEGVTGRPFPDVLHELVLLPSGMTRTRPEDVRGLIPNRARGYVRVDPGILINAALADMSYKVPGGGLSSTAPGVARFGLALISGRLLAPESLEEMLTPADRDENDSRGYGLGMSVDEREGRREAWHSGGQEGVSTVLYLRPDGGPVVAMLTNLQGLGPRLLGLAREVGDLVSAGSDDSR